MPVSRHMIRDMMVLRLLGSQRAFRHWRHVQLDAATLRILRRANRQTLMTIAAHALRRLAE